jgi:hypothetical protein
MPSAYKQKENDKPMRECLLEPGKLCVDCGDCETCDLDENKICDNCCRCLGDADYNGVEVTEIILPREIKLKRQSKPEK